MTAVAIPRWEVIALAALAAALAAPACGSGTQPRDRPDLDGAADGDASDGDASDDGRPPCQASTCKPIVLAGAQSSPCGLALDGQHVYWTTSAGDVLGVPIVGGEPTTIASGQNTPCGLAVDGGRVYWLNAAISGQVMSVAASGGAPSTLADGLRRPWKLVIRDGIIYWTNQGDGTVMQMSESGGIPTVLAQKQSTPLAIDVDAHAVYWTSAGEAAIRFLAFSTGASFETLAGDQDAAASLRVKDGIAYWTNGETGEVRKAPVSGGAPVLLSSGPGSYGIALDDDYIYWTDDVAGTVMKVPLAGGSPTILATDQQLPSEIVVDGQNIYWIDSVFDGAVMKLAK